MTYNGHLQIGLLSLEQIDTEMPTLNLHLDNVESFDGQAGAPELLTSTPLVGPSLLFSHLRKWYHFDQRAFCGPSPFNLIY